MEGDAGRQPLTPNDPDDSSLERDTAADEPTSEDLLRIRWNPRCQPIMRYRSDAEDLAESASPRQRTIPVPRRGWAAPGSSESRPPCRARGGVGAGAPGAASHLDSRTTAQRDAEAVEAAKDCVAATQAPDTVVASSAQKIIECGSGAFRSRRSCTAGCSSRPIKPRTLTSSVRIACGGRSATPPTGPSRFLVPLRVKVPTQRLRTGKRATACGDDGARRGQDTESPSSTR